MKFDLLVDLGTIVVPDDYKHETHLTSFTEKNADEFYQFNKLITDANFERPSRILKPGDRLCVRVFKQVARDATTWPERVAFLATQGSVLTGVQGASLVFSQKRYLLPKGKWYASLDEKSRLCINGFHVVPVVGCRSVDDFVFEFAHFEHRCYINDVFLCFNEVG